MAIRAAKKRPYRCQLCKAHLAENELGYVCEHVAHGTMVTLLADPPSKGQLIPDTPCTACGFAMERKRANAERDANIHVVCEPCYRAARARNIDYFTDADTKQGYVLVPRTHYDRVWKRAEPLVVGPIAEGRLLKLGFSPIPSTYPVALERMWVRVTCVLARGEIHGALANNPSLFAKRTLKADDTVVFTAEHVLEVEARTTNVPPKAGTAKRTSAKKKTPTAKKKTPKKATTKKAAKKKATTKKSATKKATTKSTTKSAR